MKKIVLSLVIITSAFLTVSAQSRFGVQAGIALASMHGKEDGEDQDLDSKIGMTLGFTADMSISENFSFRPSLNWTQKGGKMDVDILGTIIKVSTTLNYLEMPLNFVYNTSAGSGKFFIGAGPALGYGMSGQSKAKSGGEEEKSDVNFGSADDEIKPFEFSGNILAGYEFSNGFNIGVNYNMGFSNLSNASNSEIKNNYFGVRLGYYLGGKK